MFQRTILVLHFCYIISLMMDGSQIELMMLFKLSRIGASSNALASNIL